MELFSISKALCFCIAAVTFVTPVIPAAEFAGGTGEPNDPYQIATTEQLISIGSDPNLLNRHFVLVADIDLDPNLPGGKVFTRAIIAPDINDKSDFQGTPFTGRFDGGSHTIRHITIQGSTAGYLGLFGNIRPSGRVLDLCLESVSLTGANGCRYLGALAGRNDGIVNNCYARGLIFIGNGCDSIGIVVGRNDGSITNCYSVGTVSAGSNSENIGGVVGDNLGNIANCYSTSSVSSGNGSENIGGFVGASSFWGDVTNCFWDIEASSIDISDGGTALTTVQMQDPNTFLAAGWDMVGERANGTADLWIMPEAGGYPVLTVFSDTFRPRELAGVGTTEDPYRIATAEDLGAINHYDRSACYKLVADINLTNITWTTAPIPDFDGLFDGAGFVIHNLKIQGGGYLGLFSILGTHAIVKSLGLEKTDILGGENSNSIGGIFVAENWGSITDCYATGKVYGGKNSDHFGGLVGTNEGSITNCNATVIVSGGDLSFGLGGLVGWNASGSITNCYAISTVTGTSELGGLVGSNWEGTITDCNATSRIYGGDTSSDLGGLVGFNWRGNITNCHSTGEATGKHMIGGLVGNLNHGTITRCGSDCNISGYDWLGGLVGYLATDGTITDCYAMGIIYGKQQSYLIGGLVGEIWAYGTITNCYSTEFIFSGEGSHDLGGLIGHNRAGTINNCFWDVDSSGLANSAGGTGFTTAQMQTASTFFNAGWDFESIWMICEGKDYPRLQWENVQCD